MSIITIESVPTSSGDTCYVASGTPVNFSIISGVTVDLNVSFEWYLNGALVSIEREYNLLTPTTDDVVYVKVINCCSCGEDGASGNFTTLDNKFVVVSKGIITSITSL